MRMLRSPGRTVKIRIVLFPYMVWCGEPRNRHSARASWLAPLGPCSGAARHVDVA
jgi:hypothetical protein